jgi:hypothetical protein
MKIHPLFKHFWIRCLFVVCILLILYGSYALFNNIPNHTPVRSAATTSVTCNLSDKSFCTTDRQFKNLVLTQDFSDILEKQPPISIRCGSSLQLKAYCQGVQNGLIVQLFQIYQGHDPKLLTRNQYLAYTKSYFTQHGPITFTGDTTTDTGMTMHFANSSSTAQYILTFEHIKSTWGLTSVTVTPS